MGLPDFKASNRRATCCLGFSRRLQDLKHGFSRCFIQEVSGVFAVVLPSNILKLAEQGSGSDAAAGTNGDRRVGLDRNRKQIAEWIGLELG